MQIAFVGSKARINSVKEIVESLFPHIDPLYIESDHTEYNKEIADELNALRDNIDGCLFGGELHHQFYNSIFSPRIPCSYIQKDWSSLQTAFLKLSLKGIDFQHASIDSYTRGSIRKLLKDLDIPSESESIKVIDRTKFGSEYMKHVFQTHLSLYESSQVKGCITALHPVYHSLRKSKIPCVYINPTTEVIIHSVNNILEDHLKRMSKEANLAMLDLRIIPKKEYSYIRKDDYLYMHEKLKVTDEVFYFVRNTKAAVVSEHFDSFLILMNKKDLLSYTNGLQRFYLIDSVHNNTNCDVNIGIGYGFNPSEAKLNASVAFEKFDSDSKNLIYIVPYENSVIGPLNFLSNKEIQEVRMEDKYFRILSENSGISEVLLYKLYTLMEKEKKQTFMLSELARKLHLSQRNSSRLMQKLEKYGLAKFVGKQLTGKSGRPSAIFEINLHLKSQL